MMSLQICLDKLLQQLHQFAETQQKQIFSGLDEADLASCPDLALLILRFQLNSSEQLILLLALAQEIRTDFVRVIGSIQHASEQTNLTLSFVFHVFAEVDVDVLAPSSPLRWHQLIQLPSAQAAWFVQPIQIQESILYYLLGKRFSAVQFSACLDFISVPDFSLSSPWQKLADDMTLLAQNLRSYPSFLLIGKKTCLPAVLSLLCAEWGFGLVKLHFAGITDAKSFLQELSALGTHLRLHQLALYVDLDESIGELALGRWIHSLQYHCLVPLFFASREPLMDKTSNVFHFATPEATMKDQQLLWQAYLGAHYPLYADQVSRVITQFSMEPEQIATMATHIGAYQETRHPDLWQLCRQQSRQSLQNLAQRIEHPARWEDLMLPDATTQELACLLAHATHKTTVYHTWDFQSKLTYGRGLTALFHGSSGTGKTMAAGVIANMLELDLYRIDLSQTINKYIGETEKHLSKVFDMAENSGAILLFDEADALFGKRSDVSDSKDRYANMQVSYLLQRLESYSGIAILTTNFKDALDHAFIRRFRFMIEFPYPNKTERKRMWQVCFPSLSPVAHLDMDKLAQLHIAGSHIKNIALHAAFIAAQANKAIDMSSIKTAALMEYRKLEKIMTDTELMGWD